MKTDKEQESNPFADPFADLSDNRATMRNELTLAILRMTLGERRLMSLAVSKIDSRAVLTPGTVATATVTAQEYASVWKTVGHNNVYAQLSTAAEGLYGRSIIIFEKEASRRKNFNPLLKSKKTMRWLSSATYVQHRAQVQLIFNHELNPFLTGITENFTSLKLGEMATLKSVYSWRLFEILLARTTPHGGSFKIGVDDLSLMMDAPPKYRENFAQLRRRVIEVAVLELKNKANLDIEFEPQKTGRRVWSIKFKWSRAAQEDLFKVTAPVIERENA